MSAVVGVTIAREIQAAANHLAGARRQTPRCAFRKVIRLSADRWSAYTGDPAGAGGGRDMPGRVEKQYETGLVRKTPDLKTYFA